MIDAYLDDYTTIIVEIKKKYYNGKVSHLYLIDNNDLILLDDNLTYLGETNTHNIYRVNLSLDIELGKEYYLTDNYGYKTIVKYRYITKTKKFDEFIKEYVRRSIERFGREVEEIHPTEKFFVLGEMVRDYASVNWKNTKQSIARSEGKQLIYLSMEFLIGRLLTNNLKNLGIYDIAKQGLNELGIDIHELEALETDAGLGNGGLGHLAACFMDSLASLGYPGHGNTLRYEFGFFKQKLEDYRQIEVPDQWLRYSNVWEIYKPKHAVEVSFYGKVVTSLNNRGELKYKLTNAECVRAVPYDMPVVGASNKTTNTLRLWSAEPSDTRLPKRKN